MRTYILTAVSAVALATAGTALANDPHYQSENPPVTKTGDIAKDAEMAAEDIKEDVKEAYENIEAVFIDEADANVNAKAFGTVTINEQKTAAGMIGHPVYNTNQERIGTVKDIILNDSGTATHIIVADGEFPGIDMKLVAFDYDSIVRRNADGDIIMALSEEMMDRAVPFQYETANADENVQTMPSGSLSAAKVLDAALLDEKKETIAQVDNVSLRNGQVDQLIVAFDQILGLGGDKAAFRYKDAKLVRDGEEIDFQLSANQSAQFEAYKAKK
ncbi:MAG: PRC-barrel domain-containing protein [Alphaproteobacteria bacterium]|nr:PRC-barrel domain-containing protein [Alphaproteobacteria bacterium]MCD8570484.1 PRC-barrel domain-containing protein [Alphaproteobacteria bacterium]